MKKNILIPAILLALGLSSFQKDSHAPVAPTKTVAVTDMAFFDPDNSTIAVITSYQHNEDDQTLDFSSFRFTFNPDGTVVASNDSYSVDGTYMWGEKIGGVLLQFNETPVSRLNGQWQILEISDNTLDLQKYDDDGYSHLRFDKLTR